MFGNARILEGNEQQVLAIPADALQSIDGVSYLFIQKENDLFELRRVQAGAKTDGMIPILAGLSLDEQVVASQGFALKSEVLKARLGASCADH
jgi:cobalt-zinc-cadmium efflux system membrane fusion protein